MKDEERSRPCIDIQKPEFTHSFQQPLSNVPKSLGCNVFICKMKCPITPSSPQRRAGPMCMKPRPEACPTLGLQQLEPAPRSTPLEVNVQFSPVAWSSQCGVWCRGGPQPGWVPTHAGLSLRVPSRFPSTLGSTSPGACKAKCRAAGKAPCEHMRNL